MSESLAIEVSGLHVRYGDREILQDINLTVSKGEIMVIMGGSGSGKSTFLRHLLALEKPHSGTIRLLDQDITQLGSRQMYNLRRNIGVAFQGGALFNSMSVGDNIILPLREHTRLDLKTMRIMARMKMEVVNLAGIEELMPSQLSGGMIKRAALARAIIMDPRLLFFDEPSAGLDPVVSAELDQLILRLKAAMGMTIVVVTHELESAFEIADRITFLDQGRILMTGTVDEVRQSDNPRIRSLLSRTPVEEHRDADDYISRLTGRPNSDR